MNSTFIRSNPMPPKLHDSSITTDLHPPHKLLSHSMTKKFTVKASCSGSVPPSDPPKSSIFSLKSAAAAVVFAAAAWGSFPFLHSKADILSPPAGVTEEFAESGSGEEETIEGKKGPSTNSPLAQLLESNSEAIDALKSLLQQKLEAGEDEEGLAILRQLSYAQPENLEWKFLMARVLNELGKIQEARDALEEILTKDPLSYEALFENALLMDKSGEGDAVMRRLEDALTFAETGNKTKEARDVKLIMAQMQFLQKNVDKALLTYDEILKEDPNDFRPYFCKGMIFSLLDKNVEAREEFAKYRELSPKKFEVEGYLRTPLSRMKLFGTDEGN
ncbi:protein SLOW GREEN 1, chloroplastic-like [Primulina huaijiensis]|uniref:protein SLOW GREEN 1, chloroplastic-like n=1 Tax=Primulina huaijiensis TaxID=1492673 RepID=UPI003CC74704